MKDAIWDWFAFWSPVFRDVLSVGLAALGSYLAYRAIKMGSEQGQIAKRQAEIAELQHKILEEQLARKAKLEVILGKVGMAGDFYSIRISNLGPKVARDVYWQVSYGLAGTIIEKCEFVGGATSRDLMKGAAVGLCAGPIYPDHSVEIGTVTFKRGEDPGALILWRLSSEDGPFPADGTFDSALEVYGWQDWVVS